MTCEVREKSRVSTRCGTTRSPDTATNRLLKRSDRLSPSKRVKRA